MKTPAKLPAPTAMPPLQAITMGGGGEEDRFTYVLASLLQHERVARAFASGVLGLGVGPSALLVADVQHVVDSGRADLRIMGDGVYTIIEVKIDAWLHGDQIQAYARDVERHGGGRIFVLTPSTTLVGILAEARNQVESLGDEPADSVVVDGVSWQQVADFVKGFVEQDPELPDRWRVYLGDFADLVYAAIEGNRRPFDVDELAIIQSSAIADVTERLEMVLVGALSQLGHTFPLGGPLRGGQGWVGRGLHVGEYTAWLGITGAAWREYGRTPFYVQTTGRLPTWDRVAEERHLPASLSRRGLSETLVPVSIAGSGRSLDEMTALVVRNATAILAALPDAYRAANAPPSNVTEVPAEAE